MPVPKGFTEEKVGRGIHCTKGSHRTVAVSKKKRIIVCCPRGPGHFKGGRCKVGTRRVAVLTKKK